MDHASPTLTIAIPTFNRASYLDLCLRRLCDELVALTEPQRQLVTIFVSDNASTDNTREIILRYAHASQFRVALNSENVGAENNVAACYQNATTQYVWVLGDDDVVLPGGLQRVLDTLAAQQPDILYLGNYHFLEDYHDTRYAHEPQRTGVMTFREPLPFARKTNVMLTFVSALVVRTQTAFNYDPEVAKGSNLPQLGWVLPLLKTGGNFAVIEDWIVAAKGANSGGYGLVRVFGDNLRSLSKQLLRDNPAVARTLENGTIINFFPGFILEMRSGSSNFSNADLTAGLKRAFGANWRYFVFLLPLLKLPLPLAYRYNRWIGLLRHVCRNRLI